MTADQKSFEADLPVLPKGLTRGDGLDPEDTDPEDVGISVDIFPDIPSTEVHHEALNEAMVELGKGSEDVSAWDVLRELGAGFVLMDGALASSDDASTPTVAVEDDGKEYLPVFTSLAAIDAFRAGGQEIWPNERASVVWTTVTLDIALDEQYDGVAVVADSGTFLPLPSEALASGLPQFQTNEEAKFLIAAVQLGDEYADALFEALFSRPVFALQVASSDSDESDGFEVPFIELDDGRSAMMVGTSPAELISPEEGFEVFAVTFDEVIDQLLEMGDVDVVSINPQSAGLDLPLSVFAEARKIMMATDREAVATGAEDVNDAADAE